jgi:hypothetical protein
MKEIDKKVFNMLKAIYSTCTDIDTIKKNGMTPILNLMEQLKDKRKQG